ncbi:hypothetical protein [Strepsipteran arli-related virus OKIAV104]|uniref:C3H1-type domain-containing protein n=1 Tax=Strepsipteran arli-related virus OKIAV104 TaxID=2746355 RepID=A0AAE7IIB8_9MONO|nr:hypothetical protein QKS54_gp4 [Strepsipteran arli-related virus OKIAV104]QMP82291.1 hypothetical protein [Strepsipteran arli-related virus OKIAV104]
MSGNRKNKYNRPKEPRGPVNADCRDYSELGFCSRGNVCRFNHNYNDASLPSIAAALDAIFPVLKDLTAATSALVDQMKRNNPDLAEDHLERGRSREHGFRKRSMSHSRTRITEISRRTPAEIPIYPTYSRTALVAVPAPIATYQDPNSIDSDKKMPLQQHTYPGQFNPYYVAHGSS